MKAPVYINYGRFVVDCPCGDAREVEPGQRSAACVDGHALDLEWPSNAAALMAALSERINPARRNWFPHNHPLALGLGKPHGQTPDDLRREAEAGEARDAAAITDRRAALLAELKDAGITANEALAALKGV